MTDNRRIRPLIAYMETVPDPRCSRAKKHVLAEILTYLVAGYVTGHDTFRSCIAWCCRHLKWLRKGMKLQADPTVAFCFGYSLNRILTAHLSVDSPYNTYRYEGLPPGPISCPPKNCLDAVLNPEQHNYLFFCADPSLNGSHVFAATYTEHLVNAKAFQKALTERLKAKGKK